MADELVEWVGEPGGMGSIEISCEAPSTGTLSAGWYVLELVAADSGVEFDLNVRRRVEMAIKVKTAKSLASAVTAAVGVSIAAGVGSTVAASVSASMGGAGVGAVGGAASGAVAAAVLGLRHRRRGQGQAERSCCSPRSNSWR